MTTESPALGLHSGPGGDHAGVGVGVGLAVGVEVPVTVAVHPRVIEEVAEVVEVPDPPGVAVTVSGTVVTTT